MVQSAGIFAFPFPLALLFVDILLGPGECGARVPRRFVQFRQLALLFR